MFKGQHRDGAAAAFRQSYAEVWARLGDSPPEELSCYMSTGPPENDLKMPSGVHPLMQDADDQHA